MDAEERIIAGNWYAIGLYAGRSPLELLPAPGVSNPVFSYRDVTDVSAIFVADPFMIRHNELWYMFFEAYNEHTDKGEIGVAVSVDARSWQYRGRVLVEDFSVSYPMCSRGKARSTWCRRCTSRTACGSTGPSRFPTIGGRWRI